MTDYEELFNKYGKTESIKVTTNSSGENVLVFIDDTCALLKTLQSNGWMRINVYYPDGSSEEYYER